MIVTILAGGATIYLFFAIVLLFGERFDRRHRRPNYAYGELLVMTAGCVFNPIGLLASMPMGFLVLFLIKSPS